MDTIWPLDSSPVRAIPINFSFTPAGTGTWQPLKDGVEYRVATTKADELGQPAGGDTFRVGYPGECPLRAAIDNSIHRCLLGYWDNNLSERNIVYQRRDISLG